MEEEAPMVVEEAPEAGAAQEQEQEQAANSPFLPVEVLAVRRLFVNVI